MLELTWHLIGQLLLVLSHAAFLYIALIETKHTTETIVL